MTLCLLFLVIHSQGKILTAKKAGASCLKIKDPKFNHRSPLDQLIAPLVF